MHHHLLQLYKGERWLHVLVTLWHHSQSLSHVLPEINQEIYGPYSSQMPSNEMFWLHWWEHSCCPSRCCFIWNKDANLDQHCVNCNMLYSWCWVSGCESTLFIHVCQFSNWTLFPRGLPGSVTDHHWFGDILYELFGIEVCPVNWTHAAWLIVR